MADVSYNKRTARAAALAMNLDFERSQVVTQSVARKRISGGLLGATRVVRRNRQKKFHASTGGYLHEKRHGSPSEFSLGDALGTTFLGRLGFTSLPTTPFRVHIGTVHVDRRGTASITLMGGTGSKLRARVTTAAPHRRYRGAIITFAPEKVVDGGSVLLHIIDMELDGVVYPTVQV